MTRKAFILPAVAAVCLVAGGLWFRPPASKPVQGSGLLIEATAQDILEHIRALNSPLVLVNFWASWCEPCKGEFPNLLSLRSKLAARGLEVVFISIDEPRDLLAAEEFLRTNKVNFQTYYKGTQNLQFVSQIYPKWEGAVPTTVLIGPQLKIVDAWEGDATLAEFEKRVMRHLRGT